MKTIAKRVFGFWLALYGFAILCPSAAGGTDVGVSFGWYGPGYIPFGDPCAYYDYFDEPPPWGLPPDYCEYPVYFGTIYWKNTWYRGPIYYRWVGGERLFWIYGGWRKDGWHGGRPPQISWRDRGGFSGAERIGGDRRFDDRVVRVETKNVRIRDAVRPGGNAAKVLSGNRDVQDRNRFGRDRADQDRMERARVDMEQSDHARSERDSQGRGNQDRGSQDRSRAQREGSRREGGFGDGRKAAPTGDFGNGGRSGGHGGGRSGGHN